MREKSLDPSVPKPVERVAPDPRSPWWGEHRSRYHFAVPYVQGRRVLDLACGTGFGSDILIQSGASEVIGMDLEWPDNADAIEKWSFCVADGTRIPLKSASIEVAVSFETVEHIEEDVAFLTEIRRVLSDDGLLILSTPNGLHSPKHLGRPANPFHVREYSPDELKRVIAQHFSTVEILGQRTKDRYPVSPFWESPAVMDLGLLKRIKVVLWKVQNRLPYVIKDGYSRLVHSRPFHPGEFDWDFAPVHVATSHVLLAIARP